MAKMKSSITNMIVVLLVICAIAATSLSLIYEMTAEPIQAAKQQKILKAIAAVSPKFDNNPSEQKHEILHDKNKVVIYPATLGGEPQGYSVQSYSNLGYNGNIQLMVGFDLNLTINKVDVVYQAETPGLGTKMTAPNFLKQFEGKNLKDQQVQVNKDGGEIDAITAATISSRAFCDAVNRAKDHLTKYIEQ